MRKDLEKAGAIVQVVSKVLGPVKAAGGGEPAVAEQSQLTARSVLFDAVFVPGGKKSAKALQSNGEVIHFLEEAFKHGKPIGALGEGVEVLAAARIAIAGKGPAPGIIASESGGPAFSKKLIAAIAQHRHFGRGDPHAVPA